MKDCPISDISLLTLRRPNFIGVHVPVAPDLAKTVKVKSDHSENLAKVLGGAKNGKIIKMFPNNF